MAKLPAPDPEKIARAPVSEVVVDQPLWRLHTPIGRHPMRWDQLRSFGPLTTARFDPWSEPAREHADGATTGVGYFGSDVPACLAEVFQTTRHISTTRPSMQLTAFSPLRPLRLLDLRGEWPITIGASHTINSGPRNRCRAWATAIRTVHPSYDGLLYTGMAGRDCIAHFVPPGGIFPASPAFTKPLSDPGLASYVASAAAQIGYALD